MSVTPHQPTVTEPNIVFVCSAARSGSTMLDLLIGGHSELSSLGEFSFLGKALSLQQPCTCGAKVTECSSWQQVLATIKTDTGINLLESPYALEDWFARASTVIDRKHQTGLYELRARIASALCDIRYSAPANSALKLPLQPALRRAVGNVSYLYGAIARSWNRTTLVDSSKNVHKALALFDAMPTRVKVLYLSRDGRGVYHSRRSSGFAREEALSGWRRYNDRAQRLLSKHIAPECLLRLHYEEVVADPESQVRRICEFVGVNYEPDMLLLKPAASHLVNGNDMRLKGTQELKLDERWKEELVGEELAWFNANERGMNARLGYRQA